MRYYVQVPGSEVAQALQSQIVTLSRAYGVVSPFTSFENDPTGGGVGAEVRSQAQTKPLSAASFELLGNYPNPFNPSTVIRVRFNANFHGLVSVRIYNVLGQIVRVLSLRVSGGGIYDVYWDGKSRGGYAVSSGVHIYTVEFQNRILVGKMDLLR